MGFALQLALSWALVLEAIYVLVSEVGLTNEVIDSTLESFPGLLLFAEMSCFPCYVVRGNAFERVQN